MWCFISWGGKRSGVTKFMVFWWIGIAWNAIYFGNGISNTPCSPSLKMGPSHVVFDLNIVLITTCFDRGRYWKVPSYIFVFKLKLKKFLERCVAQFHLYNWFAVQHWSIIIWMKFDMKHKSSSIFQECLIKSFAYKMHISCRINLTRQFFIRTLTFSFLCIFTFTSVTCYS